MAGKNVGIIAGNYTVNAASFPTNAANEYNLLSIPAGTSGTPTYVASCNASGVYTPRVATLTWGGGTTALVNGLIGCAPVEGGQDGHLSSYITIDGLVIDGDAGMVPTGAGGGHLVQFNDTTSNRSSSLDAHISGITVQNCELRNINPQGTNSYLGGNYGIVCCFGTIGAVIKNNYIHQCLYSGTDANAADHQAGCVEIGSQNNQYLNNTFSDCHGIAIYVKEGSTGSVAAYNYIYACSTASADHTGTAGVFSAWDGGAGDPNPGPTPTTQFIHHNVIDSCGIVHIPTYGSPILTFIQISCYNNTVYETTSSGQQGWLQTASGCKNEFYNNIYMTVNGSSGVSGGQFGKLNMTTGNFQSTDYNCYYDSTGSYSSFWGFAQATPYSGSSGFTSWKAACNTSVAGTEQHSFLGNPTFSTSYVAGGGPNQFTLGGGSPCLGTGLGGANIGAQDGTGTIGANWVTYPLSLP